MAKPSVIALHAPFVRLSAVGIYIIPAMIDQGGPQLERHKPKAAVAATAEKNVEALAIGLDVMFDTKN